MHIEGISKEKCFELMEYLLLKTYFIVPFFPVFKATTFNEQFKFHIYLTLCYIKYIASLLKITWTCWLSNFGLVLIWYFFQAAITDLLSNELHIYIIILIFPFFGLLLFTQFPPDFCPWIRLSPTQEACRAGC